MRIRSRAVTGVLLSVLVTACDGGAGAARDADVPLPVITQDDASDETWGRIADLDTQGLTMANDAMSAHLTTPAAGAALPRATPTTFAWSTNPLTKPHEGRHGTTTGAFTWLHISGPGIVMPVDVVSIASTSYTPDAMTWARITAATGTISVRVISAYCNDGAVQTGPYEPTTEPTFTLGP